MTMSCNYYERHPSPYNVVIMSDVWDHEGATRTQGTITIDGDVKEWYLGKPVKEPYFRTPVLIDGKEQVISMEITDFANGGRLIEADERGNPLVNAIHDALAERHCPETSDGRMHCDCPVCASRHELDVYDVVQTLRKQGIQIEAAHVNEDGTT